MSKEDAVQQKKESSITKVLESQIVSCGMATLDRALFDKPLSICLPALDNGKCECGYVVCGLTVGLSSPVERIGGYICALQAHPFYRDRQTTGVFEQKSVHQLGRSQGQFNGSMGGVGPGLSLMQQATRTY
jgi:hypothetical protein